MIFLSVVVAVIGGGCLLYFLFQTHFGQVGCDPFDTTGCDCAGNWLLETDPHEGPECRKTRPTSRNESTPLGLGLRNCVKLSQLQGSKFLTHHFPTQQWKLLLKLLELLAQYRALF